MRNRDAHANASELPCYVGVVSPPGVESPVFCALTENMIFGGGSPGGIDGAGTVG